MFCHYLCHIQQHLPDDQHQVKNLNACFCCAMQHDNLTTAHVHNCMRYKVSIYWNNKCSVDQFPLFWMSFFGGGHFHFLATLVTGPVGTSSWVYWCIVWCCGIVGITGCYGNAGSCSYQIAGLSCNHLLQHDKNLWWALPFPCPRWCLGLLLLNLTLEKQLVDITNDWPILWWIC